MDLTNPQSERTARDRAIYGCARGMALAASAVALSVAMILLVSWFTAARSRPADPPGMARLIGSVSADPRNADLREQVRDYDRLARRAYLESVLFRKRGSQFLLVALAVMLGSLKLMSGTARRTPAAAVRNDDDREVRSLAAAAVFGFLLFLCAFAWIYARDWSAAAVPPPAPPPEGRGAAPDVPVPVAQPAVAAPGTHEGDHTAVDYWPGFRGWRGLGTAGRQDPPVSWDAPTGSNVVWKAKIPMPGFNSPVVWDRKVFLSGADKEKRCIYAFDAVSGAPLWEVDVRVPGEPGKEPEVDEHTGYAAPTLACDSRRIYAVFANGDLVGVDHDGRVAWSRNLGAPGIHYGFASSLLADGGRLFVQYDVGENGAVLAFDGESGAELWRASRGEAKTWSSPILALRQGEPVLVVNGEREVAAFDPATGVRLWRADGVAGEVAPSPASADGLVVVAMSGAGCLAIKLEDGSKAWLNEDIDAPEIPSPVVAGGLVFVLSDTGVLSCLKAETGAVLWQHEFDARFSASPVVLAGRLYLTDITGKTWVLKAADRFLQEGAASIGEGSYATPAAAGRQIFIRGSEHLFCVGEASR